MELKILLANLFQKQRCACCENKLQELGFVRGYIKSTYFMCMNKACQAHHHIVHFKNGKPQGKLLAKVIKRTGKLVTYENPQTKEIGQQEYV